MCLKQSGKRKADRAIVLGVSEQRLSEVLISLGKWVSNGTGVEGGVLPREATAAQRDHP